MAKRPHVALLIESSRAYGRGLLTGIAQYARTHGPWAFYCPERAMADPPPNWLKGWDGNGIIARIETRALENAITNTGLPAIDLRGKYDLNMPLIETNDQRIAEHAAAYLADRGFQHFAYCGFAGQNYSERRLRYFPPAVERLGHTCQVFESSTPPAAKEQKAAELHGIVYQDDIARWIESLPKPVGIMACNDIRGQQVLNACRGLGVAVPDDVAVLGVDNDELLCELSDPPMSSVEPDTFRIGYEAAALLDRMMRGESPQTSKRFVEPKGVVTRLSTDVIALEDREVAQAVRYIREHACDGISVQQVVARSGLSRSVFDRRFLKALGRTAKSEITRVRIRRAKQLLSETDYPLAMVAEMTGFKHAEYLCNVIKQHTGKTPGEHRAEAVV